MTVINMYVYPIASILIKMVIDYSRKPNAVSNIRSEYTVQLMFCCTCRSLPYCGCKEATSR